MSLSQALRKRLKGDKGVDKNAGKSESDETDTEDDKTSFCSTSPDSMSLSDQSQFRDCEEKSIYEQQLTQLQEQLVSVMIENQTLSRSLKQYEEDDAMECLRQELAYERRRCQVLEDQVNSSSKKKLKKIKRMKHEPVNLGSESDKESADLGLEATEDTTDLDSTLSSPRPSRVTVCWESVLQVLYQLMDDLSEDPQPAKAEASDGEPLTVKNLKENLKRFRVSAHPYMDTAKGLKNLKTWRSPAFTLIVYVFYMYSVWTGWLLPVFLFLAWFRLAISYLNHRGFNINMRYLNPGEEDKEPEDKDLGMSDKFTLVLQVARRVQNAFGGWADSLEKIKNLLSWKYPPATKRLFTMLTIAMVISCLIPTSILFYVIGLAIGFKVFVVDYFYERFPKMKAKYDTSHKLWNELPTDGEYKIRNMHSQIDKYIITPSVTKLELVVPDTDPLSLEDKLFCDLFSLPSSECPMSGWQGGKRCTLINREKSFTGAFKNGKLYLTRSFLCFERTKVPSQKNIVIPLCDIARLEKAKPYSWLPGSGMSIEVAVAGTDKVFNFGALLNRDECFDSIVDTGIQANQPWATGQIVIAEKVTPKFKMNSLLQHKHFSMAADYENSD